MSTDESKKSVTILIGAAALFLTISIILYPDTAFEASVHGLKLWFNVVLPALLPFFAMSEILIGLGVVHFIGVLVEPIMISIFRIPGPGAFAVAMGLASGYPIGAKITGRLKQEGLCNHVEGERIVSFANTADPLFMIGAVAVGMFGIQQLGYIISAAHYISVVIVGLIMRWHGMRSKLPPTTIRISGEKGNVLARALRAMHDARLKDGRPFGQLFGDAIRDTFSSMLFIGGTIMMFSVMMRVLDRTGAIAWLADLIGSILRLINVDSSLVPAFVRGIFEITIGSEAASQASGDLLHKAMAASAIIAWSGLSVHTQVAAMLHGTGIRLAPYIFARCLHGVFAAIVTYALMIRSTLSWQTIETPALVGAWSTLSFAGRLALATATVAKLTAVIALFILLAFIWRKTSIVVIRTK